MVEHQVMAGDGSVRWQQWVDHAIVGPDGRVTEFQGIGRDITDRKAAEELLRQSDERFQLVLRSTNAVIYDWDMDTDTLWWSPNGLKLFGSGLTDPELSLAASIHLFAWAGLERPAALNGPQYLGERGTGDARFRAAGDRVQLPAGPGLGVALGGRAEQCLETAAQA